MSYYFSKKITATRVGSVFKRVECEKCGGEYYFEMFRTGKGKGSSPYMLDNEGAQNRAAHAAQANLQERLVTEIDPSPCPHCQWLQDRMVKAIRDRMLRWMWWTGVAVMPGILAALVMALFIVREHQRHWDAVLRWVPRIAIPAVAIGSSLLAYRWFRMRQLDPNAAFPEGGRIPGLTPALVAAQRTLSGVGLEPARPAEPEVIDGWLTWFVLSDSFAPACCVCMGKAEKAFQTPMTSDRNVPVPLCGPCAAGVNRRWWMWVAYSVAGAAVISWAATRLLRGTDELGRNILATFLGIILSVALMAVLPRRKVRPYSMRVVDASREIVQLRFHSPEYMRLLIASRPHEVSPAPHAFV